ncbi:MAG: STAS domain-containing protein [Methylococcaceae bacterium]|jgi:rsbT antagonist protein RsbS
MEQTPIHKVGEFLLVSIQVDMHDHQALILQSDLTTQVVKMRAKGVLIDISTVDIVDSFIGRMLGNMASITRVLGANVVVVGMQPAVAITIVELGLSLTNIHTALNVDKGMALLQALVNKSTNEGRYESFEK